ncbi:MAG: hypothetical protein NVSMB52_07660 [Chloroflexota bacterium]
MDSDGKIQEAIFVYDAVSPDVTVYVSVEQAELHLEPNDLGEHLLIYDASGRRMQATPDWTDYQVHIRPGEPTPTHWAELHEALLHHFRAAGQPASSLERASIDELIERTCRESGLSG